MVNIRNVILSLLSRLVATARRRQCEGCVIYHTSQLQHSCLEEVTDDDRRVFLHQALMCCNTKLLSLIYRVNNKVMSDVGVDTVKSIHGQDIEEKYLKDENGTVESGQMVQNFVDIVGCVFV